MKGSIVSIHFVVPYYVEPRYLIELIDSVRAQTRDGWLLTIADDQYPGTAARDYITGLGDPRIEYVRNERNLGAMSNGWRCLTLALLSRIAAIGPTRDQSALHLRLQAVTPRKRWPWSSKSETCLARRWSHLSCDRSPHLDLARRARDQEIREPSQASALLGGYLLRRAHGD